MGEYNNARIVKDFLFSSEEYHKITEKAKI